MFVESRRERKEAVRKCGLENQSEGRQVLNNTNSDGANSTHSRRHRAALDPGATTPLNPRQHPHRRFAHGAINPQACARRFPRPRTRRSRRSDVLIDVLFTAWDRQSTSHGGPWRPPSSRTYQRVLNQEKMKNVGKSGIGDNDNRRYSI